MKRLWPAILLLFLVTLVFVFQTVYFGNIIDNSHSYLGEIKGYYDDKDYSSAGKKAEEYEKWYVVYEKRLSHFMPADSLRELGLTIGDLSVSAKEGNDDFNTNLHRTYVMLEHIRFEEGFSII